MFKIKRKILRFKDGKITESEENILEHKYSIDSGKGIIRALGIATELGFVISFPIVGGIILGNWLDKKFSNNPKFTLLFLFLGVIIAFTNLIYLVKEISKKNN